MSYGIFLRLSLGGVVALAGSLMSVSVSATEPELLKTVPSGGSLELSALEWLAPRFSESRGDQGKWKALLDWTRDVASKEQSGAMQRALQDAGADAKALTPSCYRDERCALVINAEQTAQAFNSFAALEAAAERAAPYVRTYRQVLKSVEDVHKVADGAPEDERLAGELFRRFSQDQILRYAFDGLPGQNEDSTIDDVYALYALALESDLRALDDSNIEFADQLLNRQGRWPAPPDISEQMHRHLWTLVQHGDHRPDIQYKALVQMQERFQGAKLPSQYALLYDRVMIKLAGQQRYGTQVTCEDGERVSLPLDASAPIDELRSSVGLQPLSEYLKVFPKCNGAP